MLSDILYQARPKGGRLGGREGGREEERRGECVSTLESVIEPPLPPSPPPSLPPSLPRPSPTCSFPADSTSKRGQLSPSSPSARLSIRPGKRKAHSRPTAGAEAGTDGGREVELQIRMRSRRESSLRHHHVFPPLPPSLSPD